MNRSRRPNGGVKSDIISTAFRRYEAQVQMHQALSISTDITNTARLIIDPSVYCTVLSAGNRIFMSVLVKPNRMNFFTDARTAFLLALALRKSSEKCLAWVRRVCFAGCGTVAWKG